MSFHLNATHTLFLAIALLFVSACNNPPEPTDDAPQLPLETNDDDTVFESSTGNIFLLVFKAEKQLEFWENQEGLINKLKTFKLELDNVQNGPKLYNDSHCPEGRYKVNLSNNTLLLDFPNEFDRIKVSADGRDSLNQKIDFADNGFIKLAKKDMKTLIKLIQRSEKQNEWEHVQVLIFPNDKRKSRAFLDCYPCPHWVVELYDMLEITLKDFIE